MLPPHLDLELGRDVRGLLHLRLQVVVLPLVVAVVGDGGARDLLVRHPGVVPLSGPRVVVDEEYSPVCLYNDCQKDGL